MRYSLWRTLLTQRDHVEHMQAEGVIMDLDAGKILAEIDEALRNTVLGKSGFLKNKYETARSRVMVTPESVVTKDA